MKHLFDYKGNSYPRYLKEGNAMQHIMHTALKFCEGDGIDVGCGQWPLPGAVPWDLIDGSNAMEIPEINLDFIFSSHLLEHLENPVKTVEYWKTRLRPGGVLFLYLPHPDMVYWRPEYCRKHLHSLSPERVGAMLDALGYVDIIRSERDLAWSFAVVGYKSMADKS